MLFYYRKLCLVLTSWWERDAGGRALYTALTVAGLHQHGVIRIRQQSSYGNPLAFFTSAEQLSCLRLWCFETAEVLTWNTQRHNFNIHKAPSKDQSRTLTCGQLQELG